MTWPTTQAGTTDWEAVFESPDSGLIALVGQANSLDALRACTDLLIQSLFCRKNDAPIRDAYRASLSRIFEPPKSGSPATLNEARREVTDLLHAIKEERIQRAAEEHTRRRTAEAPKDAEPEPAPVTVKDDSAEAVFTLVLCKYMDDRFAALQAEIDFKKVGSLEVPFFLSPAFRSHFGALIRRHLAPEMARASRVLVSRAADMTPEKRREYLAGAFERRASRNDLWTAWQTVWDDLTTVKKLPPKPKPQKKSLSLSLTKKKASKPSFLKKVELTPEQWRVKAREIKQANEQAEKLWAEITRLSDDYVAPTDADWRFLKELFGRSTKAFDTQFTAIRQIVEQGGDVARVFATYLQSARNVDIALLAVVYKIPEPLLTPRSALKGRTLLAQMLSNVDPETLEDDFPMTLRYLGGIIQKPPRRAAQNG